MAAVLTRAADELYVTEQTTCRSSRHSETPNMAYRPEVIKPPYCWIYYYSQAFALLPNKTRQGQASAATDGGLQNNAFKTNSAHETMTSDFFAFM